ncbi:MAG: hypothetical protein E7079_02865 [Bacteroidales bacterium]|nr:hypothetical protein [Bacteroidales bacterium]
MTQFEIPLKQNAFPKDSEDLKVLNDALSCRATAFALAKEERYRDALERTIEALRILREFSDFENLEFRAAFASLLFDLSEIFYDLKDYKQSEHNLEILFRVLDKLVVEDRDRFGEFHILAMDLSTRILRSRKKTIDMLVKQQMTSAALYEKVNSGVVAATDKLVDSLRKEAQLQAATGEYKSALKFYAEAITFSKRRTGQVTRKEIKMTIEMAEIMIRIRSMRPRATQLLNAVLPHAIALETIELEEDILALLEIINLDIEREPKWKTMLQKFSFVKSSSKKQK